MSDPQQPKPETVKDFEAADRPLMCTFCRKPGTRVKHLITGPGVFICDECVELCNEILAEADADTSRNE